MGQCLGNERGTVCNGGQCGKYRGQPNQSTRLMFKLSGGTCSAFRRVIRARKNTGIVPVKRKPINNLLMTPRQGTGRLRQTNRKSSELAAHPAGG